MDYDATKIDEAVLAVLFLTAREYQGFAGAWKSVDWGVTDRLFEQGLINDPRSSAKSVVFTAEGLERARAAAERLFKPDGGS